ncbi:WD40/YVTN/BNR-like repeat-containing protein [Muriicola sp. Z0-33]|uniref:WD40/YVTN/BNR-like repeat-containing protein n=1 Tax=Muriicola sp. Z0-33 TaxID=2816957 RepID=UPI002238D761|nr:glycosyl hydrolase [Muriicola sp. Z0-33]MCW5516320.1 glycosyl hydrolase [Muriicola sp. Z0-33]
MKSFLISILLLSSIPLLAQPGPTSSEEISSAFDKKTALAANSIVKNISFSNIGPTVMSGRVVDIEANPDNPIEYYVGYASGGVWYTNNNGTSFVPVLDGTPTQNVGDIAVDWKSGTLWVGTGENNSSRSSYAGIGILKSVDNGKTWVNTGLKDSHHVGRILINSNNSDEVIVGVTGHLYSPNANRGVFKTVDGGKSWEKTLYVNEVTGIIDMAHVPANFNIMYASSWEKDRKAWNFDGSGEGSGIYKSTDGGSSWTKLSTPESGFPTGKGVGRIGLAVYDENTVYAVLDNQYRRSPSKKAPDTFGSLEKNDFKSMSTSDFLSLEDKKLDKFLKANGFQEKYKAANVKQMVRSGKIKPIDLARYLENANSRLFDTPVIGAEVYRSDDAGMSWKKMNQDYIDDLYYSYGYYFGEIRVAPTDKEKIYLGGVPLIKSKDGGRSFTSISAENVHSDHQALWLNPAKPGHLINGNDGGLNTTYDDGKHWTKHNSTSVGQFYAVNVDNQEPYHVYGGLQDNGVWMGPHNAQINSRWHQTGHNPWKSILGGDGMQVQIDNRNPSIVYTGFQFGNYFRLDLSKDSRKRIQPKHELGQTPFRFNWLTPILLSPHNQDILYMGSNMLHRSLNQGDDWETISGDLSTGGKKGNVAYGTITTISESVFKFGLLYTGSDDGLVHLSKNGGGSWEVLSSGFPKDLWVSRIAASKHKKERVYASLNGYRWDDFTPYIYVSEDYGKSWKNIAANIPKSPVNVILEDPENEMLLFAGTDNGLYVSFNRGDSWELFQNGIPNVAIHDLVIQPEARHLVVGTHGRSIYKADIAELQQLTPDMLSKNLVVFEPENIKHSDRWGNPSGQWSTPNTPGIDITFYSDKAEIYRAEVKSQEGIVVSSSELSADKGLNIMSYDVAFSKSGKTAYLKRNKKALRTAKNGKTYLPQGKYTVEITTKKLKETVHFEIK